MAQMIQDDSVLLLNDPPSIYQSLQKDIACATNPHFILCLGSTEISDLEGISAAGINGPARRLTPAIDAEALISGRTFSADCLPVSPRGIVSPVVVTRAALKVCKIPVTVVDCGAFHPPKVDHIRTAGKPARSLVTGSALPVSVVNSLFDAGREFARKISKSSDLMILAECVPGGTTTAYAVLKALCLNVDGLLSSSLPNNNSSKRQELVHTGLQNASWTKQQYEENPLLAVAAVGDPMQAFVAGAAMESAGTGPTILAGGSQMLAVDALVKALEAKSAYRSQAKPASRAVITTKWVAFDEYADTVRLAQITKSCFAAARPDFNKSRHYGLQAYEEGNVKEGVGAGASMAVAVIRGCSPEDLMQNIDSSYEEMVVGAAKPA